MSRGSWIVALVVVVVQHSAVRAGELSLSSYSDGDSTFYEYYSDGFFRMDLFSPTRPLNQSFHSISNPSTIYNQNFDGFPNDRMFRFGAITYDESGLVNGTGIAPITNLSLGVAKDPSDPGYTNLNRFNTNTLVDSMTGSVEMLNGVPVDTTLDVNLRLEVVQPLGATMTGYYPGTFQIRGNRFSLAAEGHQTLDLIFGTADLHLEWDFSGRLLQMPPIGGLAGDYDASGAVDGEDYLLWQTTFGDGLNIAADGSGSGVVDAADYVLWRNKIGEFAGGASAGANVPEPCALCLVALGITLLSVRRGERT